MLPASLMKANLYEIKYEIKSICVEFTGDKNMKNNSLSSQSEKQRKKTNNNKNVLSHPKRQSCIFVPHTNMTCSILERL